MLPRSARTAENGQASGQELADAVRRTLLRAGTSGLVQPVLLVMILMEFATAKLDPGAELQHLMANLFDQIGFKKPVLTSAAMSFPRRASVVRSGMEQLGRVVS